MVEPLNSMVELKETMIIKFIVYKIIMSIYINTEPRRTTGQLVEKLY